MKVCAFRSESCWKKFRQAVPIDDPGNLVIGISPRRFEEIIMKTRGDFIFLSEPDDMYNPVAAAGVTVILNTLVVHFIYVNLVFKNFDNELGLDLIYEIKDYGVDHDYKYIELPIAAWVDAENSHGLTCQILGKRSDTKDRPVVWYKLNREYFDLIDC